MNGSILVIGSLLLMSAKSVLGSKSALIEQDTQFPFFSALSNALLLSDSQIKWEGMVSEGTDCFAVWKMGRLITIIATPNGALEFVYNGTKPWLIALLNVVVDYKFFASEFKDGDYEFRKEFEESIADRITMIKDLLA